jgi:hypothetical protein
MSQYIVLAGIVTRQIQISAHMLKIHEQNIRNIFIIYYIIYT